MHCFSPPVAHSDYSDHATDVNEQKTLVTKPSGLVDYLALRVPLPSVRTSRTQCARAEHCLKQSSVTLIKQACFLRGACEAP